MLTDPAQLSGGWMAVTWHPQADQYEHQAEYENAELAIDGNAADATLSFSGILWGDGTWMDDDGAAPSHYTGSVKSENGALTVELSNQYGYEIKLVNIYAANGAEYALGTYHDPFHKAGGTDGYALFFRPLH